jgi:hypothetical protein
LKEAKKMSKESIRADISYYKNKAYTLEEQIRQLQLKINDQLRGIDEFRHLKHEINRNRDSKIANVDRLADISPVMRVSEIYVNGMKAMLTGPKARKADNHLESIENKMKREITRNEEALLRMRREAANLYGRIESLNRMLSQQTV